MRLTKNFTLEEFTRSTTAKRKGIDNTPTEEVFANIKNLAENVLQPVRDAWGEAIVVDSGYRCPKLNRAVGGVSNSDHKYGAAADIHTIDDDRNRNKDLFDLILRLANEGVIECRQIIDEYNYNWIHVSVNHSKNAKRKNQVVHIK